MDDLKTDDIKTAIEGLRAEAHLAPATWSEALERLAVMALRYAWIRDNATFVEILTNKQMFRCGGGDELRSVIDAAMKERHSGDTST